MDFRARPSASAEGGASDKAIRVPPDAVRAQLERILASSLFCFAERLSRFLKFAVERSLEGSTGQLKETVLAVEIFDRETSYDSRIDSIVRVEARRLRDKLARYYETEGRDDPVEIKLPKGTYVPAIAWRSGADAGRAPRRLWRKPSRKAIAGVAAIALAGAAVLVYVATAGRETAPTSLQRLTSDSGLTFQPALSQDGKLMAYASDRAGSGSLDIWVQQVPRGVPVRLTESTADEVEPSFSPDGTLLAYRAEGDLDGIYTVPSLGGKSTLVARGGYRPRFSPDGRLLAFWNGERTFRTAKVFVVAASGGTPAQIQADFSYGAYPIWTPDGAHLLFVGARGLVSGDPNLAEWDWWVAPADGGPAIRTYARRALEKQGLRPPEAAWSHRRIVPTYFRPSGQVVFSALSGDQTNVWQIRISPRDWQASGAAEQLTFGAGRQDHPSGEAGVLLFSAMTQKSDVWALPVNPETAEPRGALTRLTSGPADCNRPVVSRTGKLLAFISTRTGGEEVWVKDLSNGRETALTADGKEKSMVVISPDGSRVAFGHAAPMKQTIFVLPATGGQTSELCADCGEPRWWLPGNAGLLYQFQEPSGEYGIAALQPSGRPVPIVRTSESAVFSPSVSPNGKWMAFIVRTPPNEHRVALVPLDAGSPPLRQNWIPLTEPGYWVDKPRWSPKGGMIYYLTDREGFVCVWARRVDPVTGRPLGEPKPVVHFHSRRTSLGTVYAPELSVAEDKLVFNLGEASGNIWLARAGGGN